MTTILTVLLIVLVFIYWRRSRMDSLSNNVLFVYAAFWLISLLLSTLGMNDFPRIRAEAYIYQLIHVFSFFLGFQVIKLSTSMSMSDTDITVSLDKLLKITWFNIIIFVFAVYSIYLLSQYFFIALIQDELSGVRNAYFNYELYGDFFYSIRNLILEPLNIICLFTFAYSILFKRTWVGAISLVAILAYNTLSGGRFGYVTILEAIILAFFCFQRKRLQFKQIALVGGIAVILFVFLVYVSAGRSGETESGNTWRSGREVAEMHILSYTSAPNLAFEYALDNKYKEKMGGFQYGTLTLSSLEGWFHSLTWRFGGNYTRPLTKLTELTQDNYIELGPNRWNALYTSSLYYYLDFGIFGLFFFPFIFGYFTRLVIKKMYIFKSVYLYFLLGYIFLKMLFSVDMYGVTDIFAPVFMLLLYYLGTRKSNLKPTSYGKY
ncbi:MAG: oligosaccharide repeat unit polymerase [Bacteroidaceae bacterium]|nr:oligosaccharide repeat unit polymerase [Bacteroidaceae bacterium]